MTMLRLLAMSAALFFASDAIGQVATLDCGSESESMVVRYIADLKPKRPYGLLVDFQSLIRPRTCPARGPCFVTETLSKELLCHKPKGVFKFRFVAVPFNADL